MIGCPLRARCDGDGLIGDVRDVFFWDPTDTDEVGSFIVGDHAYVSTAQQCCGQGRFLLFLYFLSVFTLFPLSFS